MDTLRCILGLEPKRIQPFTHETDQVYPVYASDDTKIYRKLMLNWTLRFDDVLDFELLQNSLQKLLEHGNWRKLGGRLRLNSDGNLVLHVPKEFTAERPAVRFSHQVFDMAIDEHSLARQLPKAKPLEHEISKHAGPLKFRAFGARPDAPQRLEDLLYSDEPQLAIHITSFKDATLVGLLWPHTMTGAMGLSALMNAWSLALGDRLSEVPDLEGVWDDPLEHAHPPNARAGYGVPAVEEYYAETPFVSDGDLICAWATQLVARDRGRNKAILSLNTFDVQSRLKSVFKPEPAYVQNTAFGVISSFSAREALEDGFGRAAHKYRQDIVEQTTEAQVFGQLRCARAAEKSSRPAIFGDANAVFLVITNWTKAKFYDVIDFSPAVIANPDTASASSNQRKTPHGKIVYHHSEAITTNPTAGNVCVILGQDLEGGYWIATSLLPGDASADTPPPPLRRPMP